MFNAYLTDTVILVRESGSYSWGEKTPGNTTVKAKVEYKSTFVRDSSGSKVVSSHVVTIENTTLSVSDRVIYEGVSHTIAAIKKLKSFNTVYGLEVYLV